jgi:CBS domain containing-hemolysin-like protein
VTQSPDDPSSSTRRADRPGLFDRLRALFGVNGASVREDIEDALQDSSSGSDFTPQERVILKNVLSLHELRVDDVMIPRADIIAVEAATTLHDVLSLFRTAGHSRLPVYTQTLDEPRGMVHIRDFVDYVARMAEAGDAPPVEISDDGHEHGALTRLARFTGLDLKQPLVSANILRPVLFAPPSMPVLDLLVKMQATRTHMALVIDEYGGTDGLVSIEDIMEMIVGDIEDEHDLEELPQIEKSPDGTFIVDARATPHDVAAAIDPALFDMLDVDEFDTLGGLVSANAGRLLTRGEIVKIGDRFEAEVIEADPRRVKRMRLRQIGPQASSPSDDKVSD